MKRRRVINVCYVLLPLGIAEPVGSVRPKFPTMDNSRGFVSTVEHALTLLCPAQGFPVPSHRWDKVAELSHRSIVVNIVLYRETEIKNVEEVQV